MLRIIPALHLLTIGMIVWGAADLCADDTTCGVLSETRLVRGSSMAPLVKAAETITLLKGFYGCYPIEREDIVIYEYASTRVPAIKIVKGVPGDRYRMERTPGGWRLFIDGRLVKNSQDRPYELNDKAAKMLGMFHGSAERVIPLERYLILGNQVHGSRDSTRFGLAAKDHILGKVILPETNKIV